MDLHLENMIVLFTLSKFAGEKWGVEKLWGESYYDTKLSRWYRKKTKSATCKRGFIQFCYEPIKQIFDYASDDEMDSLYRRSVELGFGDLEKSDGTSMVNSIMLNWVTEC